MCGDLSWCQNTVSVARIMLTSLSSCSSTGPHAYATGYTAAGEKDRRTPDTENRDLDEFTEDDGNLSRSGWSFFSSITTRSRTSVTSRSFRVVGIEMDKRAQRLQNAKGDVEGGVGTKENALGEMNRVEEIKHAWRRRGKRFEAAGAAGPNSRSSMPVH